jgi:nucleotide-binding universal stress UspA family protein
LHVRREPIGPSAEGHDRADDDHRPTERDVTESLERLIPEADRRKLNVACVSRFGVIAPEILAYASQTGTDLIVMGRHERDATEQMVTASIAEHVLHHAPCPTLIVRPPNRESFDAGAVAARHS